MPGHAKRKTEDRGSAAIVEEETSVVRERMASLGEGGFSEGR
jgi:hypothetical protein